MRADFALLKIIILLMCFVILLSCTSQTNHFETDDNDEGTEDSSLNISVMINTTNNFMPVHFGDGFFQENSATLLYNNNNYGMLEGPLVYRGGIVQIDSQGSTEFYEEKIYENYRSYIMTGESSAVVLGDYTKEILDVESDEKYYSYLKSIDFSEPLTENWSYQWFFEENSLVPVFTSVVGTGAEYYLTGRINNEHYLIKLNLNGEETGRNMVWASMGNEPEDFQNIYCSREIEGEGILMAGTFLDYNQGNPVSDVYCLKADYGMNIIVDKSIDIGLLNPCSAVVVNMEVADNGMTYLLVESTINGTWSADKNYTAVLLDASLNVVNLWNISEEGLRLKGTGLGNGNSMFFAGMDFGLNNAVVIKLNSSLEEVWKKTFSAGQYTEAYDVFEMDNGNLLVYGAYFDDSKIDYQGNIRRDGFLRTLNLSGNLID